MNKYENQDNEHNGDTIANLQDIFKLAEYIKKDMEYNRLVPDSSYTTIKINKIPEVLKVRYMMARMTNVFTGKNGINNRFTNYLITELGINHIKKNWTHTLELKKLVKEINFFTSINNPLNLDLDKILLTGVENDSIVLFMSHRQRDDIKLIHELIGSKTEGSIAYICVLLAINDIFRNNRFGKTAGTDYLEFCVNYFDENKIYSIDTYVQKHAEILYPYIKEGCKSLVKILIDHDSQKVLLSDNVLKHIVEVLMQIDKLELDEKE